MAGKVRGIPLHLLSLALGVVTVGPRLAQWPLKDGGNVATHAFGDVAVATKLLDQLVKLCLGGWHHTTEGLKQQLELVVVYVARSQQLQGKIILRT